MFETKVAIGRVLPATPLADCPPQYKPPLPSPCSSAPAHALGPKFGSRSPRRYPPPPLDRGHPGSKSLPRCSSPDAPQSSTDVGTHEGDRYTDRYTRGALTGGSSNQSALLKRLAEELPALLSRRKPRVKPAKQRHMQRRLTPEQVAQLVSRYEAGDDMAVLANRWGCTERPWPDT